MGDLTKNISRSEVACKCGNKFGKCQSPDAIDFETITIVQGACDYFADKLGIDKVTLIITSGARCSKYNDTPASEGGAGGSNGSKHKQNTAIDHRIAEVSIKELYDYYEDRYPNRLGLAYKEPQPELNKKGFVHVDPRKQRARWTYA